MVYGAMELRSGLLGQWMVLNNLIQRSRREFNRHAVATHLFMVVAAQREIESRHVKIVENVALHQNNVANGPSLKRGI